MLKVFTAALAIVFMAGNLFQLNAQELPMGQEPASPIEVSDDELEEFVDVAIGTLEIQQQTEMQYPGIIQEAGLSIELFQEISQAEQMGGTLDDLDVSESDLEAFDAAIDDIQQLNEEAQEQVIAHVESEDMELDRYEEIAMALQQDQELMEKVQSMLMQSEGMQQQQQQQPQQQAPPQEY